MQTKSLRSKAQPLARPRHDFAVGDKHRHSFHELARCGQHCVRLAARDQGAIIAIGAIDKSFLPHVEATTSGQPSDLTLG